MGAPMAAPMIPPSPSSEMPAVLLDQIKALEKWALANRSDAKRDTVRFWMLKAPAIAVSASAGLFAYFKLEAVAVVAGAIASLCVLMDALNPGGALKNVHTRAFNELRRLEESMVSDWDVGRLRKEDTGLLAARIIEASKKEKDRISAYITAAETSLATTGSGKRSISPG